MQQDLEIIVVGAGIAGASVAAHLAETHQVAILEMEERPGYHTTGRSAATYEPNYGPPSILAFTRASHEFFMKPPAGFADGPLFVPRSTLLFEAEGQAEYSKKLLAVGLGLEEIGEAEAKQHFPILRDGYAKRTLIDRGTGGLDVDLLHRGYLKLFKQRGGALLVSSGVQAIGKTGSNWRLSTSTGEWRGPVIVNAAGAWGDVVAGMAGVPAIGLQPKRRSIGVIPAPTGIDTSNFPFAVDVGETWYAIPQSGKLLVSSADATPVEPHDAYADDMAIAEGIERLERATTMEVGRLEHSWGGLRTFARDGAPVIGFDPSTEGFFWLAGQGGYGIQSAPALSRCAAALVRGEEAPEDIMERGLVLADITPNRLRR